MSEKTRAARAVTGDLTIAEIVEILAGAERALDRITAFDPRSKAQERASRLAMTYIGDLRDARRSLEKHWRDDER